MRAGPFRFGAARAAGIQARWTPVARDRVRYCDPAPCGRL